MGCSASKAQGQENSSDKKGNEKLKNGGDGVGRSKKSIDKSSASAAEMTVDATPFEDKSRHSRRASRRKGKDRPLADEFSYASENDESFRDDNDGYDSDQGSGVAAERRSLIGRIRNKSPSGRLQRSPSYEKALLQETEAKPEKTFKLLQRQIASNEWLKRHPQSKRDDIARFMKKKEVNQGEYIAHAGEPCNKFYIIESGTFELLLPKPDRQPSRPLSDANSSVSGKSPNGDDADRNSEDDYDISKVLYDSGYFGETSLQFKQPWKHSVRARNNGILWWIDTGRYQQIMVKDAIFRESKYTAFLRKVPILAQLTDEQLNVLGKCLTREKYRPGEVIITQGTKGSTFYFIEKGTVGAYQRTRKGDQTVVSLVNTLNAGDYFGEGALLEDAPRSADVIAERTGETGGQEAACLEHARRIEKGLPEARTPRGASSKSRGKRTSLGAPAQSVVCLALRRDDFVELLGGLQQLLDKNFTARVLKGVSVLSSLTDAERAEIADNLVPEKFGDGEKIISQGDEGDRFYVIKEGEIVFRRKEQGESTEVEIGRLFKGQVFGEGALLTAEPRRASAYAVGPAILLSLERSVFSKVFNESLQELLNRDFTKRKDPQQQIEFSDLEKIKVLGAGTYGEVLLVSHRVTGATYALKCLKRSKVVKMEQIEHLKNEREILSQIQNHPFVVNLVQTFAGPKYVFAMLEAVLGGELFAYMRKRGKMNVKDTKFYVAQVILVFEYLHSMNIIYRDLKPENILLTAEGYIKLTDFGLSKLLGENKKTYTLCGTPAYAAPEVYDLSGHGKPVDWWGLGTLVHELVSGTTPFDGDAAAIFASMKQYARAYPNICLPRGLEGKVGDFVLKLLHPSTSRRLGSIPTGEARGVKAHPLFDEYPWTDLQYFRVPPPYKPEIGGMYDTKNFYAPSIEGQGVDIAAMDASKVLANAPWKF